MPTARMFYGVALVVGLGAVARGDVPTAPRPEDRTSMQAGRDELRMGIQEICPVSGNKLGEHGTPVKVAVGEHKEEISLCCKGCARQEIDRRHWGTIHANFARAQRICPVMKHELPERPRWTIVHGQIIFVCCPPCINKIVADPTAYLKKIDEQYTASLDASLERSRH